MTNAPSLYVPVEAIIRFLDAARTGDLQTPVTLHSLRVIGTPDSVAPRTLRALEVLGFVRDNGEPTDAMQKFSSAEADGHVHVLASTLREAYSSVFEALPDIASASHEQIEAAFAGVEPATQRHRMIRLFLGLCQYAGIVDGRVRRQRRRAGPTPDTARDATPFEPAEQHRVDLRSGGTVEIAISVRLFELSREDRDFVLELVDRVRSYGEIG